ncbi:MAG: hypothetical protein ACLVAA_12295 [Ruthenibacterium sp.]
MLGTKNTAFFHNQSFLSARKPASNRGGVNYYTTTKEASAQAFQEIYARFIPRRASFLKKALAVLPALVYDEFSTLAL